MFYFFQAFLSKTKSRCPERRRCGTAGGSNSWWVRSWTSLLTASRSELGVERSECQGCSFWKVTKLQTVYTYIYICICYTTPLYYERFIYQEVHIIPTYTYKCTSTLRISKRSSGFCKNEGSLLEGSIQMVPIKVPFIQLSTSTTFTFLSDEKGSGQL